MGSLCSVYRIIKTVDSCYLESKRPLLNTSRYPYLDISNLRNRDILKTLQKRGEIAPYEQFIPTIFCNLLEDFQVKTGTRFSHRDKQLFEISEIDITKVDCTDGFAAPLADLDLYNSYMPWLREFKIFLSCPTQLSNKFYLVIQIKIPTIKTFSCLTQLS